jgi:SWI/SNF-related matrix-associated actin-dependent regulator of chromatin subfamily A-like protein 1
MRLWLQFDAGELVCRLRGVPDTCKLPKVGPGVYEMRDPSCAYDLLSKMHTRGDVDEPSSKVIDWLLSDLPAQTPADWSTLGTRKAREEIMPHQRQAVDRIIAMGGRAAITMPTGTGKTLPCSLVSAHYGGTTLVLASAQTQWKREIGMWTTLRSRVWKGGGFGFEADDQVVISTFKALTMNPEMHERRWTTVIVDESHKIGGKCDSNALVAKVCARATAALMVSATPMKARPRELFNQLNALLPRVFDSREDFEKRYCDGKVGNWGYYESSGSSNTEELNAIMQRLCITCNKAEALPDLLPVSFETVALPLSEAELQEFRDMDREYKSLAEELKRVPVALKKSAKLRLDAMGMKMYMRTAVAKAPKGAQWLVDFMRALQDPEDKVLVFYYHTEAAALLERGLNEAGISCIRIDGKTLPKARDKKLEGFVTRGLPGPRVALLSLGTSAESLNLVGANTVIMFQDHFTPTIHDQAYARAWRKGQTKPVKVIKLLSSGTYDDVMTRIYASKRKTQKRVFKEED